VRLVLSGAALLALAVASAMTPDRWVWAAYVLVQVTASYVYLASGMSGRGAAAITPGICVVAAHAWSMPFRAMLARMPDTGGGPHPALWSHGGVALLPILLFAAVQVWLITEAAASAPPSLARRRLRGVAAIVTVVNLVSVIAFVVATIASLVLLQLVVARDWFPYASSPAFGLFWLGHTLALESLVAVAGGVAVRGIAARRAISARAES